MDGGALAQKHVSLPDGCSAWVTCRYWWEGIEGFCAKTCVCIDWSMQMNQMWGSERALGGCGCVGVNVNQGRIQLFCNMCVWKGLGLCVRTVLPHRCVSSEHRRMHIQSSDLNVSGMKTKLTNFLKCFYHILYELLWSTPKLCSKHMQ